MDPLAFLLSNPDYATEPTARLSQYGESVGRLTIRRIVRPPIAEHRQLETRSFLNIFLKR